MNLRDDIGRHDLPVMHRSAFFKNTKYQQYNILIKDKLLLGIPYRWKKHRAYEVFVDWMVRKGPQQQRELGQYNLTVVLIAMFL